MKGCQKIPLPKNVKRQTEDRHRGVRVSYQCYPGHFFPDGSRLRTLMCLQDNTWHATVPDCAGK